MKGVVDFLLSTCFPWRFKIDSGDTPRARLRRISPGRPATCKTRSIQDQIPQEDLSHGPDRIPPKITLQDQDIRSEMPDHPFQAGAGSINIPYAFQDSAGAYHARVGNVEKERINIEESRRRVSLFLALCCGEDRRGSPVIAGGSVAIGEVDRDNPGTQSHPQMRNERKIFVTGLEADEKDLGTVAHIECPLVDCFLACLREVPGMPAGFGAEAEARQ
jgi:hypothetical protein